MTTKIRPTQIQTPGDATKFLDGTGAFAVPSGGSSWVPVEHRSVLGSNYTLSTHNAWTTIPGLSLSYTPSQNEMFLHNGFYLPTLLATPGSFYSRLLVTPTPSNYGAGFQTYHENVAAGFNASEVFPLTGDLTSGTAYTFEFQMYTTQDLTVNGVTASVLSIVTFPR